jgi:hypothetical protein
MQIGSSIIPGISWRHSLGFRVGLLYSVGEIWVSRAFPEAVRELGEKAGFVRKPI